MASIRTVQIEGSGSAPKNVEIGSIILFDATEFDGSIFQWLLISLPEGSLAYLSNPSGRFTKLKNIDNAGVYQCELIIDQGTPQEKRRTASISVPGSISPLPLPPEPAYDLESRVRNFSFELVGIHPGWANDWTVRDDANILGQYAGTQRGRIKPVNFITTNGIYAMCLGDDLGTTSYMAEGQELSIEQEVDLTDVETLQIDIKFTP